MDTGCQLPAELKDIPINLSRARRGRGLSQRALAERAGLTQAQVSLFEAGRRLPSLPRFVNLARALDVPLQGLLTGSDRPGTGLNELAVELSRLGAVDLWAADAIVPGAARPPEEVIALAVRGGNPEPRVIEAVPALLSWNRLRVPLLRAYGVTTRTTYRLAWLADVALTIERRGGFPGGCRAETLSRFLKGVALPPASTWDDLGRPSDAPPSYPSWKRWRIGYAAGPEQFEQRARSLLEARPSTPFVTRARRPTDGGGGRQGRSSATERARSPRRADDGH